jgi:CDP-diacylglycerol--glycerol-3-phosphate 3-phosphatidyltransferase
MESPSLTRPLVVGSYWRHHTPFLLTTFRLLLGPVALVCALEGVSRLVYLPILVAATLSDIFDGILARRFGVATQGLRRYDSVTDVSYYLFLLAVVWILCKPQLLGTTWAISILLLSEAACVVVSVVRFGKYPATHTYLAKFYGLALLAGLVALLVFNASGWVIVTLMLIGLVTNIEIIFIHLAMNVAPVDVSSIFALYKRAG